MFDFIQRFFVKPASSSTAKERLRLVLLSDHLSLAPDVVESLKHDLIEVISRYVDVDAANCDVSFEQQDKQVAMLANIPILALRSRPAPRPPAAPPASRTPDAPAGLDLGGAGASMAVESPAGGGAAAGPAAVVPAIVEAAASGAAVAPASAAPAKSTAAGGSRKRRRKRPGSSPLPSPG